MVRGTGKAVPPSERPGRANAGLAWDVASRIDTFVRLHPEEGMNSRNDFTNRACIELLDRLETLRLRRMLLEEMERGRLTSTEALAKLGLTLPHEKEGSKRS